MSESLVGRAVASTRQNAGTVIVLLPLPLGGVNGPAAIALADLIVTVGMVSAARFVQDVPVDAAGVMASANSGIIATTSAASMRRDMGECLLRPANYTEGMMIRRTFLLLVMPDRGGAGA